MLFPAILQQAIERSDVDKAIWGRMAPLGCNELMLFYHMHFNAPVQLIPDSFNATVAGAQTMELEQNNSNTKLTPMSRNTIQQALNNSTLS